MKRFATYLLARHASPPQAAAATRREVSDIAEIREPQTVEARLAELLAEDDVPHLAPACSLAAPPAS